MLKSNYFYKSVIAGIVAGIFGPLLMFWNLAKNPGKNLYKLILFFSALFFIVHIVIAITGSGILGVIIYFIPWIIYSAITDHLKRKEN